tara:strand:+ start:3412 stop:4119 length:708 start_codon:yes stop_codon:yes gene_type:complete
MLGLGVSLSKKDYSGGWLPTDESSLLAWYKLGTATIASGSSVNNWPDSSGNGFHMIQESATSSQPRIDSTTGIVTFDGADDFLALASGNITIEDQAAFLIAFRVHPTDQNRILLGEVGSNTEMIKLGLNASNLLRVKPGGVNADFDLSSGDVKDDAYWIVSREAGAADLTTVFKDGSQVDATIAAPGEFNISQMGKRTTSGATENEFKGEIYEIIIFGSTSADLITNVTNRLAGL